MLTRSVVASWLAIPSAFVFCFVIVTPTTAGTIAYQVNFGTPGNQAFGGAYGMDFDVNAPIEVTKLGVFDSGSDGLGLPITAQLWSRSGNSGTLVASLPFSPGDPGTLVNGSRFKPLLAPVVLPVGSYTIGAYGYGAAEPAYNSGVSPLPSCCFTDGLQSNVSFVGTSRYGLTAGAFPDIPDGGPANRYATGTFEFEPIPSLPSPHTAYRNHVGGLGTQDFGGPLGLDFIVHTPIRVVSLGAFDSNADGIFANSIGAELWTRNDGGTPMNPADDSGGVMLASQTFTPNDPGVLDDSNRFKRLSAPLVLTPGAYTIVGHGYGLSEPNGNFGTGGPNAPFKSTDDARGALTFVGGGRYDFVPGAFPANFDGGPVNRYSAGTFQFEVVPEPSSLLLAVLGAAVVVGCRRRRW